VGNICTSFNTTFVVFLLLGLYLCHYFCSW